MMRRNALGCWAPRLAAGTFALLLISATAAGVRSLFFANDPILEVASDCLTTFRYSGNSAVQDVRPQVTQRGVLLDGSVVAGPTIPAMIAGNPFERAWGG